MNVGSLIQPSMGHWLRYTNHGDDLLGIIIGRVPWEDMIWQVYFPGINDIEYLYDCEMEVISD